MIDSRIDISADELYDLFRAERELFPHIRKDYVERAHKERRIITSVLDNQLVAAIIFKQYMRSNKRQLGEKYDMQLCQIIVAKEHRGTKIARELFERFELVAKMNNAKRIVLAVREENTRARNFYKKMNMKEIGDKMWQQQGEPLPGKVYAKEL